MYSVVGGWVGGGLGGSRCKCSGGGWWMGGWVGWGKAGREERTVPQVGLAGWTIGETGLPGGCSGLGRWQAQHGQVMMLGARMGRHSSLRHSCNHCRAVLCCACCAAAWTTTRSTKW